ncbi:MAG: hypothetical protein Q9218_007098 [Villophora microphyllina]
MDRRLRRFVKDPKALRSFMGKHDVLISGSFAIQFFERVTWDESDLDLYAEQGPNAEALEKYLCEQEGYKFARETGGTEYWPIDDWLETRTFTKKRPDFTEAQIQIVITCHVPIYAILNGFYSTLVVNVISWNKAYAIYPQPSFLYHKSYLLRRMDEYNGKSLAKYDARGWKSQDILWPEEEASHACMLRSRRLNDRYTWTIPLDTQDIPPATIAAPDFVLEYTSWQLSRPKQEGNLFYYKTYAEKFSAPTLKYRYVSPAYWPGGFWKDFLGPRMDRMSLMELHKIPVEKRSQLVTETMKERPEDVRTLGEELARCGIKLQSYDHEIPGWFAEWERKKAL